MIKDRVAFDLPHYEDLLAGHYVRESGYARRRPGGTDDWLLIATLAGEGRFVTEEGEVAALPGSLTLLSPGTTHDYGAPDRWELLWVHFHPPADWLDLLHWPLAAPGIGILSPDNFRPLENSLREVVQLAPTRRRRAMNALENLLLLAEESHPIPGPRLDDRIRQVVEHIHSHLDSPLTVDSLSELVHLSPSRFAHLFRAETGLPPMEYVTQRRIARARQLLERTTLSIGEIATQLGMDPFHFSARFKSQQGTNPRTYRLSQIGSIENPNSKI